MDREAYQMLDYGARAHWVYKLEKLTRQKFDHKLLQICAKKMTGNLLRDVKMTYDILSQWVYVFTPESGMVRPIRVNAKAIPVDAASYVFNEKIDQYAGVRIGKVWAPGQLRDAGEFNPLEDGDYLVFKRTGSGYIDRIGRKAMIAASQHQETKALLYPDDRDEPAPKSSRGKKNLRRK